MHNQRETGKAKSGAMASILSAAQGLHRSGVIVSTVLTLAVIPAIYALVKQWQLARGLES